jgi:hypothetical protein
MTVAKILYEKKLHEIGIKDSGEGIFMVSCGICGV